MTAQTPGRAADALRRAVEARIELWRQVGETSEDLDGLAADARDAVRMCAHELTEDLATWQEQARQFAAQERPAPASASQVRRHEAQTSPGLAEALLKVRAALRGAPTASIARREALLVVDALDLDGLLAAAPAAPQPAPGLAAAETKLRDSIRRLLADLYESAAATRPSRKSEIEDKLAAQLRQLLETASTEGNPS